MGKFDDSVDLAKSIPLSTGGKSGGSQYGVTKALSSVTSALASSPQIVGSGKYADSVAEAQKIAAGKTDGGGIAGVFGDTLGKALEGFGYVAGIPARAVTSVVKETADLLEGQGFSVKELVTQPFDKDFYASQFIPKTGNKWVDVVVGLGTDVLTDPLTYVSFGANLGRSGRIALAGKAAEAANIAKAPELAGKLDDIVRYGEWALNDAERELLGIPKGLRWQFGKNETIFNPDTLLGRVSGAAAEAVGRPFAGARAALGDVPALNRIQGYVRPKSYGGALNALGRRSKLDGIDVMREVARYSAGVRARAQRGLMEQVLIGDNQALLNELENSPFRESLYEVIEGTADRTGRAVSQEERDLADRVIGLFAGSREKANEFIGTFNARRGTNAFEIGLVDDYFMGSLTPEAQGFVSNRNFGKGKWDTEIGSTVEITPREFITGPSVMRGRKLEAGQKWLGEVLQVGDKAEINRISREVLGFDWFKTDALSVVADYIDNIGKQTGRIAFVDRLFDYGPDVVDKIMYKMVPDQELVGVARKAQANLTRAQKKVANLVDRLERQAEGTVGRVATRAEAKSTTGAARVQALRDEIAGLSADVAAARRSLRNARSASTRKSNEIRKAYEVILQPLEARIQELEGILARGGDAEELAATLLKDLHVRAFPEMDDALRPTNYRELARDIKSGAVDKYNVRMGELAPIEDAGGDVKRQVGAAKGQFTKTEKATKGALEQIKQAKATTKGVRGELRKLKAEVAKQKRIMEDAIKNDPAVKNVKDAKQAHARAVNALNARESLLPDRIVWENTVKPELDAAVSSIRNGISGRNFLRGMSAQDREAGRIITQQWIDNAEATMRQLDELGVLTPSQRDAWDRVITSMRAAEVDLARVADDADVTAGFVRALSDPENPLYGNIARDIKDGWVAIEKLGIQLPQDTADTLFRGIDRFNKVEEVKEFLKMFNKYNQFFRVTAMLNPGFVVRNAYTAAFNNFVYGVTFQDTADAIRFATVLHKSGITAALDSVPAAERALYEEAYRGVVASGAGQIKDISTMPLYESANIKLLNTRLVKVWGTANSDAEVGARMAMALRAARNGDNIDQIATTVARYHFDYSDLSKLDEFAKVFVPFWTFASRNIPLQIMNQIARPSMYRAYESAKRNMPVDAGMILPSWLAEREPLGFGAGAVLNPDLPMVDMESQIRQLSDPLRLLSQLYPQYKLPIELAGNRQLGLNIPFSNKPEQISGPLDLPAALLGLITGQGVDTAQGPAVTAKTAYAATSAIPTLGLLQRLIPQAGGQDKYKDRQLSSLISTLTGAPYREVTEREQQNELLRRQFALSDYLNSLQGRGYVQ